MSDGRGMGARGSLRVLGVVGVAAVAAAACGSSDTSTPLKPPGIGRTLGALLYQGDVDSIDPGRTLTDSAGDIITNVTQRGLTKPPAWGAELRRAGPSPRSRRSSRPTAAPSP